jgi:splicing factor 3B subunit 2
MSGPPDGTSGPPDGTSGPPNGTMGPPPDGGRGGPPSVLLG